MHKDLKKEYFKRWRASKFGQLPYIIFGWVLYPFINRSKTRLKYYKTEGSNWWNRQLWYMLNDDELHREKNHGFDFDYEMVKLNKNYDLETRWGQFKASYWFNARRNPAYNYMLTHAHDAIFREYEILETEYNTLETEVDTKKSAMLWATWNWNTKNGKISNKGVSINEFHSIRGKSKCWFLSNGKVHLRWSHAIKYKFLWWTIYEEFKMGTFGNKYDITFKEYWIRNK